MELDHEGILEKLDELRADHRALDVEISEMSVGFHNDQLRLARLKRKKLILKDEIATLEAMLYPDIIA